MSLQKETIWLLALALVGDNFAMPFYGGLSAVRGLSRATNAPPH